ncbi:hypothetical protein SAMN04244560_00866 [Thermoanaerobacter thermohydrosulfuricus]|uniref:Uncharacterized protein n=1 Tax=Thermoanaerobacter thermohydrosulfuricus TaxID=1516 RepID=A0A1G7LT91_THETY|nr:hypothetical protein [Thermoanaerobacter thermohydrosulfuricus]SDF52606.1 hypothetical protein SAMN04244560_00866 [Thermoanaerobacter thermohydrosulfuricus]
MYYFTFCENRIHKISVKGNEIILHDHTEEEAENEYILSKLTGTEPEIDCFKIYKVWKEGDTENIPFFLRNLMKNKKKGEENV